MLSVALSCLVLLVNDTQTVQPFTVGVRTTHNKARKIFLFIQVKKFTIRN